MRAYNAVGVRDLVLPVVNVGFAPAKSSIWPD